MSCPHCQFTYRLEFFNTHVLLCDLAPENKRRQSFKTTKGRFVEKLPNPRVQTPPPASLVQLTFPFNLSPMDLLIEDALELLAKGILKRTGKNLKHFTVDYFISQNDLDEIERMRIKAYRATDGERR